MSKKTKKKSSWLKKLFFCFIVYFAIMMVVQQVRINTMRQQSQELEDKLNDIQRSNKEMSEQTEIVKSEEYIEYLMRLKLGWVKPDEKKFVAE